jgi:hypothetical protein
MGWKEFYENESFSILHDIEPPICFQFAFTVFRELYNGCREGNITYQDMESYCRMKHIELTQYEIELVKRMNYWANDEVDKLKNDRGNKKLSEEEEQ